MSKGTSQTVMTATDRHMRAKRLAAAVLVFFLAALPIEAFPVQVLFSEADVGSFPSAWKARESAGRDVYSVRNEGDGVFLHAESAGNSHSIGHDLSVDPSEYPHLSFFWRALNLPAGGNENRKETNDGALGVYVIFEGWAIPPRAIKYVWSSSLPEGTETVSPYSGKTKVVVLRSGPERAGHWISEAVNVLEDYRRLFGEERVPRIKGIGILTDSDNTGSFSSGDYREFRFTAEPTQLSVLGP